jgi:hypothetical protein
VTTICGWMPWDGGGVGARFGAGAFSNGTIGGGGASCGVDGHSEGGNGCEVGARCGADGGSVGGTGCGVGA